MCVQGKLKKGKFVCLTCWQKQENNKKKFKKQVLRRRIFSFCKNCKKKSRVSRTTNLCFLCDNLNCIL